MDKSLAAGQLIKSQVDGGLLELWSLGSGADVVVVEGGATNAHSYRLLVTRLAEHARVHIYDRRARGNSADRPVDYSLATEASDLISVLAETGAVRVIGHSSGGLFALAAARQSNAVERLALFDPAISVDGSFPTDLLPELEATAAQGDPVETMLVAGRGLQNPGSNLPKPIQRAAIRLLLRTGPGHAMGRLIHTAVAEARIVEHEDGRAEQWASVTARTRFYIGARSPRYYQPAARELASVMPDATVEVLPRLGHDAAARAPRTVISSLVDFLDL